MMPFPQFFGSQSSITRLVAKANPPPRVKEMSKKQTSKFLWTLVRFWNSFEPEEIEALAEEDRKENV